MNEQVFPDLIIINIFDLMNKPLSMIKFPGYQSIVMLMIIINCHLSIINGYAQQKKLNQKVFDLKSNHDIMIGYCNIAGMTDTAFNSAFRQEYDTYTLDKETIYQLTSLLDGVTVTIVMGSWCSDSREQVPRFMKLFDALEHAFPDPVIICADRDKKAGDVSLEVMNILKVPTFIIYYKGRELGRIIETPKTTMEKDFLDILKKQL